MIEKRYVQGASQLVDADYDEGELIYRSLVRSLASTLGPMNAEYAISFLEREGAISNGRADIVKLDVALRSVFGNASFSVVCRRAPNNR